MTPEEILRDLRDIHLPEQATEAVDGFVLWPSAIVLAMVLVGVWLSWRRGTAWRREIVRHLAAIERRAGAGQVAEGWTDLAVLLRRIAIQLNGRRDIAGLIGDAWLERLDRLFGTDAFSHGPGRGIAVFPYSDNIDRDSSELERITDQLRATIKDIRTHLPRLGTAR
ncbi:MAG: DUF4381 domain-containing protein [Geminicoccaceae bacterium]